MTVKFQADADLNQNIVTGVLRREAAIDFQTALAVDLEGVPDEKVLEITAKEQRILVSHDRRTMPLHFADFITRNTSYGVLIVPQDILIAEAIENIILIWSASDVKEWIDRIFYLPL